MEVEGIGNPVAAKIRGVLDSECVQSNAVALVAVYEIAE